MAEPLERPPTPRIVAWIVGHRWPVSLFVAALIVRLYWNLVVHPVGDFMYSDMRGYVGRADAIFDDPWGRDEYLAFYPYGTHVLVFVLKAVSLALGLGREGYGVIAVAYAVMGAGVVVAGYDLCRRMSAHAWVAPAVGSVLVVYYPLISLGGYVLSEVPFCLCLVTSANLVLRILDQGRLRDAWLLGAVVAIGFTLRPQILASVAVFLVVWLAFRRHMPAFSPRLLLRAGIPLALVAACSAGRLHYHTGRAGLIAENGPLNRVLGHCHARLVRSLPDRPGRRSVMFSPPAHIQLAERTQRDPNAWVRLDPVLGPELQWKGYIGDRRILQGFVDRCHEASGLGGQLKRRLVNLILLSGYNTMWPDSGAPRWKATATWWGKQHARWVMVPALIALVSLARPRTFLRPALVAVHLVALLLIAGAYLGGTRLRAPYDPFSLALALEVVAVIAVSLVRRVRAVRNPGNGSVV